FEALESRTFTIACAELPESSVTVNVTATGLTSWQLTWLGDTLMFKSEVQLSKDPSLIIEGAIVAVLVVSILIKTLFFTSATGARLSITYKVDVHVELCPPFCMTVSST